MFELCQFHSDSEWNWLLQDVPAGTAEEPHVEGEVRGDAGDGAGAGGGEK